MKPIRSLSRSFLPALILVLCPALPAGDDSGPGDDPILKALEDELARSMTLKLEDLEKPYFIQYDVEDTATCRMAATCGAIVSSDSDRSRNLYTQVRVGSYDLDNTNFGGGGGMRQGRRGGGGGRGASGGRGATPLPVDDDYMAIRQAVWMATDGEYKNAVETLTQKRVYMDGREIEDRPGDFSEEEPVQSIRPIAAAADFDRAAWEGILRRISARFLDYGFIKDSGATLNFSAGNAYLVNSEGSRIRSGTTRAVLRIIAEVQSDDGERLSDSDTYIARSAGELPGLEEMLANADKLAERLQEAMSAKILESYTGPVLFDGEASPQLFHALLARGVAANSASVGGGRRRMAPTEDLEKYIDKRILPRSFGVYDDPTIESAGGTLLAGHYTHDDEAVKARRVDIIVNGTLKEMLTSRTPTDRFRKSNGHGRRAGRGGGAQASLGCLFVETPEGLPREDLKRELLAAAEDQGLEYALRVTSLQSRGGGPGGMRGRGGDPQAFFRQTQGEEGSTIGDPVFLYKVYVEDGREEPVRGCEFGPVRLSHLRDIIAAGKVPRVFNTGGLAGPAAAQSVIAPPVIIEELDLFGIEQEREKKPYIEAPHTRGR